MQTEIKKEGNGTETPPKPSIKEFIYQHIKHVYEGNIFENKIYNTFVNTLKLYIVATRKFLIDDCFTKASSIAYTAIISLIPALTVILTFYSIFAGAGNKKDELFRDISLFMIEHSIKINIDPVFDAISSLIDNAGRIGGIGAIVMLFTATATLRAMEKSLNSIWKVKEGRSLFQKVIYYWAALTLGPVMLIAGTTVATKMSDVFSSAHYNSAYAQGEKLWLVGSKGTILTGPAKSSKLSAISETSIDYENQYIYIYKFSEKQFIADDFRLDHMSLMDTGFRDVQFIDNEGWIVGNKGIILHTEDSGKNWKILKIGSFALNDIHMLNNDRGFIAADSGVILTTNDGGMNWQVIETGSTTSNFNSISFRQNTGIITGNRGTIIRTDDGGRTWTTSTINEAKRKNKLVDLNSVSFISSSEIWIAGNNGILLHSTNGGRKWNANRFKEYNYYSSVFLNRNEGYIAGENGIVIHTVDGGENWKSDTLPAYRINKIFTSGSTIWAIGNGGTLQKNAGDGRGWAGKSGKGFFAIAVNFLAPFLFIWVLFLLAYTTIPNTKVPFRYSATGAAFTGTIWVLFILLFIMYTKSFAKGTFAIYGALASIPLFLLMIYASSLIILYGAEVSYTMMHPETYKNLKHAFENVKKVNMYFGFIILQHIYFKFEEGKGSSSYSEIIKKISYNSTDFDYFIKMFTEKRLILKDENGDFMPSGSSKNIKLLDVFDMLNEAQYRIPPSVKKGSAKGNIKDLFGKLKGEREKVLKDMTLKDLVI